MITPASMELSKKLYKLSTWEDTDNRHVLFSMLYEIRPMEGWRKNGATFGRKVTADGVYECWPAYSLGYLRIKLLNRLAACVKKDIDFYYRPLAEALLAGEDAVCELAIKWFTEGIIYKEKPNGKQKVKKPQS